MQHQKTRQKEKIRKITGGYGDEKEMMRDRDSYSFRSWRRGTREEENNGDEMTLEGGEREQKC